MSDEGSDVCPYDPCYVAQCILSCSSRAVSRSRKIRSGLQLCHHGLDLLSVCFLQSGCTFRLKVKYLLSQEYDLLLQEVLVDDGSDVYQWVSETENMAITANKDCLK